MEAIRAARPHRLYVAADGPRDRPGEADRCEAARRVATSVDWPCDLRTLFRDRNLGCRDAVSEAISWFFDNELEGIVLEDDCLPSASFFPYCAELLERYRENERVMCITGNNFQSDMCGYAPSYYFSKYNHVWGWASWRRAWRHYDRDMKSFPAFVRAGRLEGMSRSPGFADSWEKRFKSVYRGKIDTWDYQWLYSCWVRGGVTCTPRVNLVTNIGFGAEATHTTDVDSASANMPAGDLDFPLAHPAMVEIDEERDAHVDLTVFGVRPRERRPRWRRRLEDAAKRLLRSLGLRGY